MSRPERKTLRPVNTERAAPTRKCDSIEKTNDAMIALQRAELTLQLTVQVRNKLVQAYQDIMRMQV